MWKGDPNACMRLVVHAWMHACVCVCVWIQVSAGAGVRLKVFRYNVTNKQDVKLSMGLDWEQGSRAGARMVVRGTRVCAWAHGRMGGQIPCMCACTHPLRHGWAACGAQRQALRAGAWAGMHLRCSPPAAPQQPSSG